MPGLGDLGALAAQGAIQLDVHPNELRFAGTELTPEVKSLIFRKWKDLDRDVPGRPVYEGRDKESYENYNTEIRNQLIKMDKQNASSNEAIEYLISKGYDKNDTQGILNDLYSRKQLRPVEYQVANAQADENINRAVLHYSGFEPVLDNTLTNNQATDLSMTLPGGGTAMIDAQSRNTPQGLFMPVVAGGVGGQVESVMIRNPNMNMLDAIKSLQSRGYIREDKLLHSADSNINPIQSKFIAEAVNRQNEKDYIISSNRPNARRLGQARGPYNAERAYDYDLIDMEKARRIILPMNYSQLERALGEDPVRTYGNKTTVVIPNQFIKDELTNSENRLDPRVVEELKGGQRVMPPTRRR